MTRSRYRRVTFAAALLLTAFAFTSTLRAGKGNGGKPGAEPPPAGTIYFEIDDGTEKRLATMNADGTNKSLLPASIPSYAVPGYRTHNGVRWLLKTSEVDGEFLPDGSPLRRLEAVREDGGAGVPLFQDSSLYFNRNLAWSRDDGLIAFSAVVWDDSIEPPEMLGTGLYVLAVSFDEDGPRVNGAPLLAEAESGTTSGGAEFRRPVYSSLSFSPDGAQIVYVRADVESERSLPVDIVVTDLLAGQSRFLAFDGQSPDWSPDGSTICFDSWNDGQSQIQTIAANDLNESTRSTLIEVSSKPSQSVAVWMPRWSPNSDHVIYILSITKRTQDFSSAEDIYRVGADGKGNTNLTADTDAFPWFLNWR